MNKEIICTAENEGFRAHYFPGTMHTGRAVISLGGASCDEKTCTAMAGYLRRAGWNVLVLGYYLWEGLPAKLCNIPLEYAEKAVKWLKEEQNIKEIAMTGVSEGASYAMLCAGIIPDISCVVPVVPYDYVTEGMSGITKRLHASVFSYRGESIPYTEMSVLDKGTFSLLSYAAMTDGYGIGRIVRRVYDLQENNLLPESRIRAENMNADILMLAVKGDDSWPSDTAVPRIAEALRKSGYSHRIEYHIYEKGSHMLFDGFDQMSKSDRFVVKLMFPRERKYPDECRKARRDSLERILNFLNEWESGF